PAAVEPVAPGHQFFQRRHYRTADQLPVGCTDFLTAAVVAESRRMAAASPVARNLTSPREEPIVTTLFKFSALSLGAALVAVPTLATAELYVTVFQGLGGQPQNDQEFTDSRSSLEATSRTITSDDKVFSSSGEATTREPILEPFKTLDTQM